MQEFARFTIVRVGCAVLSYAVYLLALLWFSYNIAYAASYVFGIALAYITNAIFVFKRSLNRKSALLFPLVYIFQFGIGYILIKLAIEIFGIPEWLGLAFSVSLTLPLMFVLSRKVMRIN